MTAKKSKSNLLKKSCKISQPLAFSSCKTAMSLQNMLISGWKSTLLSQLKESASTQTLILKQIEGTVVLVFGKSRTRRPTRTLLNCEQWSGISKSFWRSEASPGCIQANRWPITGRNFCQVSRRPCPISMSNVTGCIRSSWGLLHKDLEWMLLISKSRSGRATTV